MQIGTALAICITGYISLQKKTFQLIYLLSKQKVSSSKDKNFSSAKKTQQKFKKSVYKNAVHKNHLMSKKINV